MTLLKKCANFCTIMSFFIKCVSSVYKYLLQEINIKKRLTSCHVSLKLHSEATCLPRPANVCSTIGPLYYRLTKFGTKYIYNFSWYVPQYVKQ